jgi:TrmH family RNA methyltransferase
MGTLFWLPIIQTTSSEFFRWARSQKHSIIGTSSHAKNDNQDIFSSTRSLILLLGSEQKGLQPDQLSLCDATIALPMRGRATSLNLAVAAGVLLYKLADISKKQAV